MQKMTTSWLSGLLSRAGRAARSSAAGLRRYRGCGAKRSEGLALTLLVLGAALPSLAATDTVTSLADDGSAGTLRSEMAAASAGDTIVFSVTGTITLTQGYLEIAENLTISGPGASSLAISGDNASRVFYVDYGATANVSGVTIENGSASDGGGIYNRGVLTLNNCVLSGNSSSGDGGGIYSYEGTLTVSNSTLSGNHAPGGSGGGIFNFGYTLTVSSSSLSGSSATYGGAIYNNTGSALVSNSTLSGNTATYGGAINTQDNLTVSNSTLSGNAATDGGAIYDNDVTILSDSTLSGNSASRGGAIFTQYTPTLKSTLMAGQTGGGNCFANGTSIISDGYNLSDDASCSAFLTNTGDQNNVTTAGLSPSGLQNNGGPTETIALLSTSSAVNAIPVSACTDALGNPVTTDQRGVTRPQGPGCDIGAFELVPQTLTISPASINFGTVYLGTITDRNITLTNSGTTPIAISEPLVSIVTGGNSGDFVEVSLCPKSLAPGKQCTIAIAFLAGPFYTLQTATLKITDNAPGSPQTVMLTATVIDPQASFEPSSLNCGNLAVGTSATETLTLWNTGATALLFTGMTVKGTNAADFTLANSTCGSSLASGSGCAINVTFKPTAAGSRSATLNVADNMWSGAQTVPLSGRGH